MIDAIFIQSCAPHVAPETIAAIIQIESAGNPIALNTNRKKGAVSLTPKGLNDAVAMATAEIAAGNTVDVGFMQLNSANFGALDLTVEEAFNPCTNLWAASRILIEAYGRATKIHGAGQTALRAALSHYNTGNFESGLNNGYVARFYPDSQRKQSVSLTLPTPIYMANPIIFQRIKEEK